MFPPSVLAKVYVKGSLKNTEKGFEFSLKNIVDSGTIVEFGPITVDGKTCQTAALTVAIGSNERPGDQVTRLAPLSIYLGSVVLIRVNGETLSAGEHVLDISFNTREAGRLHFEARDSLA
jgi:hydroxymethylglutaryl-CoA reductase (NADPH)